MGSNNIRNLIDRVIIGHATIRIHLSEVADGRDGARILTLPWTRPSPYRKREIIQGANDAKTYARPMPANARAILIEALRDAHRWLDGLLSDPRLALESIALREGRTVRSIRMTLSLAFLAPEIVKAAVEGRLPRGFGLTVSDSGALDDSLNQPAAFGRQRHRWKRSGYHSI
jgi:site-specific DNA recombinase